jgi:hypothetical protein
MSLKRLTAHELAVYHIGKAVIRQLERAPRDPDTIREIDAVARWITHWLSPGESRHVMCHTGWVLDPEDFLADAEMQAKVGEAAQHCSLDDDDIPF